MKDLNTVLKFLSYLGLDFEESQVYISLFEKELTILQISKVKKISRTTVYRIIERLERLGLVEALVSKSKRYYRPVGQEKLEVLVKEQESKSFYLRQLMPEITNMLPKNQKLSSGSTEISVYNGVKEVSEMLWNITRAKETIRIFMKNDWDKALEREFLTRLRLELVVKNISQRILINKESSRELMFSSINNENEKKIELKMVPRIDFEIYDNTILYDGVVAYFKMGENLSGVEIHDYSLFMHLRQTFDINWAKEL